MIYPPLLWQQTREDTTDDVLPRFGMFFSGGICKSMGFTLTPESEYGFYCSLPPCML